LSAIPGSRVIGTDINFLEIQQAARVFQNISYLHFIYAPVDSEFFKEKGFDTVVFAASLQYFESLTGIINSTLRLLKPGGEIHIIDSPFYSRSELLSAKQRSRVYFEAAGFSEMVNYYFHHCLDDLNIYNYSILHDPKRIFNKFSRQKNPFYWIRIQP
jgi:ubiquinone/menaquinone biosynthesis C-methylase UbiE